MQKGRSLRTLDIDVGGYNLCEEVLSRLEFPVNNPTEKDHFLTPTEGRTYVIFLIEKNDICAYWGVWE